jgi:ABC-type cobalamin/Fe3+-siderophores transport system ATPase subunit
MICVKTRKTHILKDINFQVEKASIYKHVAPDNFGKSTLLNAGVWELVKLHIYCGLPRR